MIADLVQSARQGEWAQVRQLLLKHWLVQVPQVFQINSDMPWDNSLVNERLLGPQGELLFSPLVSAFSLDAQNLRNTLEGMNEIAGIDPAKRGRICGHVFRNGELTYTCLDCATDGTCVMCLPCFEVSIHKSHKYRMHSSSGSGYCDCGDADAWTDGYACVNHEKKDDEEAAKKLTTELKQRCEQLVEIILHFALSMITHKDDLKLPDFFENLKPDGSVDGQQCLTVLYNDETHTYESVIKVLELYIHCTKDQAMLVATIVDREGRSAVKQGSRADCTKAKEDVQKKTLRDAAAIRRASTHHHLPLSVKVMDTTLFTLQSFSISLLTWLNAQMDVFPPLREIVGETLLTSNFTLKKDYTVKIKSPDLILAEIVRNVQEVIDVDEEEAAIFQMAVGNIDPDEMVEMDEAMEVDPEEEDEAMNESTADSEQQKPSRELSSFTILENILLQDTQMWKAGRCILHQLLMRTVFMIYNQKERFAKAFMQHYDEIYSDFIKDDHEMEVSVVGLSVQFMTVPGLARKLVAEDDAFSVISNAIRNQTNKYVKDKPEENIKRFDFTSRSFPPDLRRALHITRDLAYILNAVPTESDWTPELIDGFIRGFSDFLVFLQYLQGMDEVKRQAVEHQVWESEWETAFNILLRLKDAISLIIAWAETNEEVHNRVLLMCLELMDKIPPVYTKVDDNSDELSITINGDSCKITHFDVLKSATSVHQPVVRMIAGLFTASNHTRFLMNDEPGNETQKKIKDVLNARDETNLYELSLRVIVLCAQSNANLWRRNGFSLINQIHNYFSPLCRNEMFDRDVLMMQVGAATTPPIKFLIHLLHRFRLDKWATIEFEQDKAAAAQIKPESEDLSKTLVTIAEEFFQCLILILCERYTHGVGETTPMDGLKREVIHILCTGSHTFSHIQQKVSNDNNSKRISLHDAVNQVADFRKPLSTSAGQFHCKETSLPVYSPFFMHYSKSDQSAAEQNQARVRAKLDKKVRACSPPSLPDFLPFFKKIPELLTTKLLIHIFRLVIDRTARRSRFSSDRLFHKALYLIGIALSEEEKNAEFGFTHEAEESFGLLALLEGLVGKQESSICPILLEVTIEKYRKLMTAKTGSAETGPVTEQKPEMSSEELKAKRAARAAEMRQKAMAKMSSMQSKFMKKIEDDEKKDEVPSSNDKPDVAITNDDYDSKHFFDEDIVKQIGHDFPVCIGTNKWQAEVVKPRTLTCILCQEDEVIAPQQGKPMVCAAFIQQSQLFTHKNKNGELLTASNGTISTRDLLTAPATLQYGVDVSTCSHSMHHECYKSLSEANRSRESLRARQLAQHTHKMVDVDNGEYQCPLCKRLSNAAIPVLPAYQLTNLNGFSTVSGAAKETFEAYISRVKRSLEMPLSSDSVSKKGHSRKRSHSERSLLDLEKTAQPNKEQDGSNSFVGTLSYSAAHSDVSSSSQLPTSAGIDSQTPLNLSPSNVDVEFYNELAALFVDQDPVVSPTTVSSPSSGVATRNTETASNETVKKPLSSQIQHALYTLIRPFPALIGSNRICPSSFESYEESIKDLGKNMIKYGRRGNELKTNFLEKHLKGYVISTVTWQSTAHVARAISSYLHYDKKPLFGALNTRQRDCLSAMARLCATLSHNMQYLLHAVSDMLRVLLCEPPKTKLTQTIGSPLLTTSSASQQSSTPFPHSGTNVAFFVQLFNPAGPRKNVNLNILQVDILSLAISLMMTIGWTWNNGSQSMNSTTHQKARLLTPDGSVDEAYVLRLSLLAHYFQIIATHDESDGDDVRMTDEEDTCSNLDPAVAQIITKLYSICHSDDAPLRQVDALWKKLEEGAQTLLRPVALLYHFITLVDPPEALKDPSIYSSEALFRYLGLPQKIEEQIHGTLVETLFTMWSSAIPKDTTLRQNLVVQPVRPNLLVELPEKYSQLINKVASFKCPTIPIEESTSNVPTLCLVCGMILCSQAYCCQKIINKQSLGACRYHMSQCSGSVGMFLRVRDCSLVLMTTRQRGCFRPAPYVDEFGEVDQGFRRGNPLHLNHELYQKLKSLWLQQGITEEVVNYNEIDYRNVQYDWAHF